MADYKLLLADYTNIKTIQKFEVGNIFNNASPPFYFVFEVLNLLKSLRLTKAAFIWPKYSKIVTLWNIITLQFSISPVFSITWSFRDDMLERHVLILSTLKSLCVLIFL